MRLVVDLTLGAPEGADDAATTTRPTPQDPMQGLSQDSTAVTAGLGGFLVVFALGLAVWFLGRDLTRRLRRMSRAEEERVEAERAARAQRQQPGRRGQLQGEQGRAERDPLA